jgi:hypothetical protein
MIGSFQSAARPERNFRAWLQKSSQQNNKATLGWIVWTGLQRAPANTNWINLPVPKNLPDPWMMQHFQKYHSLAIQSSLIE